MENKTDAKCIICNQTSIFLYTTYDRHYGFVNEFFDLYCCKNCEVEFLFPMIEQEKLNFMYNNMKNYYAYVSKYTMKDRNWLKKLLIGSKSIFPKAENIYGKNLLDLGCGDGEFLFRYMKKGVNTYGVEVSKDAVLRGRAEGVDIFYGELPDARFPNSFFDVIRSNHSFEHLINPMEMIEEASRIIKVGGQLFIGVPNINSINFKVFKKYWYFLGAPFHPYNYSPKSLQIILERYGFKITDINYVGNHQGVLGSIQIFINRKNKKSSLEGSFTNNFTRVFFEQFARLFNLFKKGDCIEVLAIKK